MRLTQRINCSKRIRRKNTSSYQIHEKNKKARTLEGEGVAAEATAKRKFLSCGRVGDAKGTLTLELPEGRACRAVRQFALLAAGAFGVVVVAPIAEVCRAKAEVHRHRAAEAAVRGGDTRKMKICELTAGCCHHGNPDPLQ